MITLTALAVLGGVVAGCGSPDGHPTGTSGGAASPVPRSPGPEPTATQSPAPGPPTLAAGPAGRTPVFERRPKTGPHAGEKVVALTFDADMTADQGERAAGGERFDNPQLISLLRGLKVESTLFMTGRWAEEYPEEARSIGTDPMFEIANHSYSHYAFSSPCYGLPVVEGPQMREDVERAFEAFRAAGARNVVPYFRFPGGCYDDEALRALAPAKVTAVQWDVVSGDAFATDADAVADQVLEGVRPGSLVVMHCTRSAAPVTADALRRIVPELRERGYRFVKVSELMRG
ncbi:polysaccharide deacetylase family protein [uncultured Streptomyces sp.]|uniref:polysaccharide deacetylase family protein n=1 Tax=uncultured Streptomyces sp. TaxID=174707 RepID=UPI0026060C64|nr:polysaccharide deacetylase family protein [uncultured Streptomyces sp.]